MKKMINSSIDVFAETNPAFCSIVVYNFCLGYSKLNKDGVPFPLVILLLPIILSNDLLPSFDGTNVNTGFFRWIENNPEVLLELSKRINESNEIFLPSINYGLSKRIFQISNEGLLIPIEKSIRSTSKYELKYIFRNAERLGNWFGQVNSTKTIYNHLGLKI